MVTNSQSDGSGRLAEEFTSGGGDSGASVADHVTCDGEYKSHSGEMNANSTPNVQYTYSEMSGGANHGRLTSVTYPDGFVLNFNYSSGLNDTISRLSSPSNTSRALESYSYLGLGTVVIRGRHSGSARQAEPTVWVPPGRRNLHRR